MFVPRFTFAGAVYQADEPVFMGDVRGMDGRRGDGIVDVQRALDEPSLVERAQRNLRASTESSATKVRDDCPPGVE